jgi:hypothetical protein
VTALGDHLRRHERENETERFALAPPGTFARFYTRMNLRKTLTEPGWCRIWVVRFADKIVGHASLYDMGEPDGVVFGHIGIEKPYRGWRLAADLQRQRLAFCDEHDLTLCGAVALGNDTSFHGCRRMGFEYLRQDPDTKEIWLFRPPGAAKRE